MAYDVCVPVRQLPVVPGKLHSQPLERKLLLILSEVEAVPDPVADIDGFLVDASTGMVPTARKNQDDISLPIAAAGAADIADVLSLLADELPAAGCYHRAHH